MPKLVLTVMGDERPGLVAALSRIVAENGGNWLESELAILAGKFAGVVVVDLPADRLADFREQAAALRDTDGLDVALTEPGVPAPGGGTDVILNVVGQDRPGIVQEISSALASWGVTIEELHTSTREPAMSDGVIFEAESVIRVPGDVSLDDVRGVIEGIAAELMVDLEMGAAGDIV